MFSFLDGYKTYAAAVGLLALAVYRASVGDYPGAVAAAAQGLAALGLRHAIDKIPDWLQPAGTLPTAPPVLPAPGATWTDGSAIKQTLTATPLPNLFLADGAYSHKVNASPTADPHAWNVQVDYSRN